MYSKYERQMDKRQYGSRRDIFIGPQFLGAPERVIPTRVVEWNEVGLPVYVGGQEDEEEQ